MVFKKFALVFCILAVIAGFAVAGGVSVERELLGDAAPNGIVKVKLKLSFLGEKPSGIIVTEKLPKGWTLASSMPQATKFDENFSWLLYGSNMKDSEIVYELKAPQDPAESTAMDGIWETISENGIINGDGSIILAKSVPAEKEPEKAKPAGQETQQPPTNDNTLIYAAGVIILLLAVLIALQLKRKK